MSWDNVGPNHCHMDGTPITRSSKICTCGPYGLCHCGNSKTKEHGMSNMEEEHDFGFSFTTEEELTIVQENTEKVAKLRDMIMPLLMNLKKNPEKDIIKWEGSARIKSIDAFIQKMNKLVDN